MLDSILRSKHYMFLGTARRDLPSTVIECQAFFDILSCFALFNCTYVCKYICIHLLYYFPSENIITRQQPSLLKHSEWKKIRKCVRNLDT
jgi:hypothetical protein